MSTTPSARAPWTQRAWLVVRGCRVPDWLHFLAISGAAIALPVEQITAPMVWHVLRGSLAGALALACAYLVNSQYDRDLDRDDHKNPFTGDVRVSANAVMSTAVALTIASLVLAGLGARVSLLAAGVSLLTGWLYSVPPRLKRVFPLGTMMNLTIFAPLAYLGLMPGRDLPPGGQFLVALFALLLLQNQLIHEHAHHEEDHAGGVRTTRLMLGLGGVLVLITLFSLATGALYVLGHTWIRLPLWLVGVGLASAAAWPLWMGLRSSGDAAPRIRLAHRYLWLVTGTLTMAQIVFG